MLKILGAVCILLSSGYLGFKLGDRYRRRTEILRFLQNGLSLLEKEISYSLTPLPLALSRVGEKLRGESRILFLHAGRLLNSNKGLTAAEAWEQGVYSLTKEFPLEREEVGILIVFGHGLGCSAREEQIKNIALAREQLRMMETVSEEARAKNQRMWQYMGLCSGGVIILLLI